MAQANEVERLREINTLAKHGVYQEHPLEAFDAAVALKQIEQLSRVDSPSERPWLRYEREIAKALYPRIHAWIEAGMPPAQTAFTAGLERTVAQLCEEAVGALGEG